MSTYQGVKIRVRGIAKRRSGIERDPGGPKKVLSLLPVLLSQPAQPLEEKQLKKKLPVPRRREMESGQT